ncbi:MAG: hypothetical protein J6Z79_01815 [Clostridia bacterium]|nr:hypothetical protein [Clostridia bacterium]
MRSLLVVGAGSFSVEAEELARLAGYDDIAFLDDHPESACCQRVIGAIADMGSFRDRCGEGIVALGDNRDRLRLHRELKRCGYTVPILVHPASYVSPDAVLSPGCIVRAKAVVSRFARLGEAVIINAGALIDHHVVLGDGCHVLPGAVVRNKARVEALTRVESLTLIQ